MPWTASGTAAPCTSSKSRAPTRAGRSVAAEQRRVPRELDQQDRRGRAAAEQHAPRERDQPVRPRQRGEDDQAERAAEPPGQSGDRVLVERRERACEQRGQELHERRGHEKGDRARRLVSRRRVVRERVADRMAGEDRDQADRHAERQEGERPGPRLARQAPVGGRPRQLRHDDEPERLGGEPEHEVDAVGGQEAVRRRVPAEPVREQHRGARAGAALQKLPHSRQEPTPNSALTSRRVTLSRLLVTAMSVTAPDSQWTEQDLAALRARSATPMRAGPA